MYKFAPLLLLVVASVTLGDMFLNIDDEEFPIVDEFELERYLGYWYQVFQ